jgi:hypothetical protein
MIRHSPLLQRGRLWLLARWQRRWRLTRRGRVVVASLGVLLIFFVSSLIGSWVRDPLTARGLPAIGSRPAQPSQRAGGAARGFTLIASGDVLTHGAVLERARAYGRRIGQPYDFRPMFADLRPIVSRADLAVCHLEVPLSRTGQDISSWPAFNAPPQLAVALRWAGYDACSTASNHSMDQGAQGVAATLAVMDTAGLRHAGMARTANEAGQGTILNVRGLRVGLLSYTYGLNSGPLPATSRGWSRRSIPAASSPTPRPPGGPAPSLWWYCCTGARSIRPPRPLPSAKWPGGCWAPLRSTSSSAITPTWCSRSSGSGANGSPTAWATHCPTRRPAAVPPAPRTAC